MVTLALALVDRLIALVQTRQATKRQLHDDFVQPIVTDFERLHENYVETFKTYRLAAEDATGGGLDTLVTRVESDSLTAAHLRARLLALADHRGDPLLAPLVSGAHAYLMTGEAGRDVLVNGSRPIPNAARQRLVRGLRQIAAEDAPDGEKRARAGKLIDEVLTELQGAYLMFVRAAQDTKRSLLDSRV